MYLDVGLGLASIDGVHKNVRLPSRSTGGLMASGLRRAGLAKPVILETLRKRRAERWQREETGRGH